MKAPDWIVSVSWLARHLKNVKIIDARWYLPKHGRDAEQEYLSGHLPGAIPLNLSTDLANQETGLRNSFPSPEKISKTLGERGIQRGDTVIVYDDKGFSACRIALILHLYGQASVAVLDGGYSAWVQDGQQVEEGSAAERKPVSYDASPFPNEGLITLQQLRAQLGDSQCALIDARSALRFEGKDGEKSTGHMPGAVSIHYAECFQKGSAFFLPPAELRALFESRGVFGAKDLVSTCGSGVTASILIWALKILGRHDVRLYDGSWDEWSRDESLPVERS